MIKYLKFEMIENPCLGKTGISKYENIHWACWKKLACHAGHKPWLLYGSIVKMKNKRSKVIRSDEGKKIFRENL